MTEGPLPRATQVLPAGRWSEQTARHLLTLDFNDRFRRRKLYVAEDGFSFLLDLGTAVALRHGDGLLLEGGDVVLVRAAAEPVVEVMAETPEKLARLAWHLGNRHLPTQIAGDRLLIRDDHVIVHMLEGLGATLRKVSAPFDPEGGAYGEHNHNPGHHHHHHGDHDHHHDHDHAHGDHQH